MDQILPSDNSGTNWLDSVLKLTGGAVDAYAKLNQAKVDALATKAAIPSNILPAAQGAGFSVNPQTVLLIGAGLAVALGAVVVLRR